jgi:hypothetical protein
VTQPRVRRALAAGAGAAAAALILAAPAGAADMPDPKVSTSDGQSVIKFLSHTTKETFTAKGGETTTGQPQKRPDVGDAFGFVDENSQDGTTVGTDSGRCSIVSATATAVTSHCLVTVVFANGTLTLEGDAVFADKMPPFTVPITAGTGSYAGAHGTARVVEVNADDSNLTLTYGTTVAGSGDQVAVTPVGGAETGGGSTAAGGNPPLFALGGIGMTAGAMLFVAGRRARRRCS